MSEDHPYHAEVATFIRALLNGNPPNGILPEAIHGYCDIIATLLLAHSNGGTAAVRAAWRGLVRRHPELIELVSGDASEAKTRMGGQSEVECDDDDSSGKARKSQATGLVELAGDAELFHTPDGEAYATIPLDGYRETCPLRSKAFRRWLAHQYYRREERTPSSQAVQDALGVLEGLALFDGTEYPVFTRLVEHHSTIYLDLTNDRWEAVEITAAGWRVIAQPPVKLRRAKGMLPIPHPASGGTINELRRLINVANDADWTLLSAWLVQALRGPAAPTQCSCSMENKGGPRAQQAASCEHWSIRVVHPWGRSHGIVVILSSRQRMGGSSASIICRTCHRGCPIASAVWPSVEASAEGSCIWMPTVIVQ